ncbi:MAG: HipA N-terminal domain-containing protein [Actinomycetota bacterium]
MSVYKPVKTIEVFCWDRFVGGLAHDPKLDSHVFEYSPEWINSGIELAPLHMPLRKGTYVFPQLSRATYYGLPAMIADSLPDDFGNAVIDAWLAEQGISKNEISSLDRLGYAGDRAIGALAFEPAQKNLNGPSTAIQLADVVAEARELLARKAYSTTSSKSALHI